MKTLVLILLAAGAWQMRSYGQTAAEALAAPLATSPAAVDAQRSYNEARRQAAIHSKWNICVDLQMVALEEGKALDLIPDLQSDDRLKVDAAWNKVQAMIKSKEATLLAWPMVRLADTDRAVAESIVEQRYPTEFEPGPRPKAAGAAAAPVPAVEDKPVVENSIPTAFETRNIGATVEVEATVLDEGKRVHLNIDPQRVELLEMEKIRSVLEKGRVIVETPQPLFGTSKTTEALTVLSGERQLIAVHKLTKPAGYIELHFVRAVITKTE
jgi:hypothetical protein